MKESSLKTAHLILGDQLSEDHPFLNHHGAHLVLVESLPRANWLPYHPKKLLYIYTCMRRFACEVFNFHAHDFQSSQVFHRTLGLERFSEPLSPLPFPNDLPQRLPENSARKVPQVNYAVGSSLSIGEFLQVQGFQHVELVDPAEPRMLEWLAAEFQGKIRIHPTTFFLGGEELLPKKKPYLMENFCRQMRRRYRILLDKDGAPVGGRWNYDDENSLPPSSALAASAPQDFLEDDWRDTTDKLIMLGVEDMLH